MSSYETKTRHQLSPSAYVEAIATTAVAATLDDYRQRGNRTPFAMPEAIGASRVAPPKAPSSPVGAWIVGVVRRERLAIDPDSAIFPEATLARLSYVLNVSPPSLAAVDALISLDPQSDEVGSPSAQLLQRLAQATGVVETTTESQAAHRGPLGRLLRWLVA